jgi:hypothetical protein
MPVLAVYCVAINSLLWLSRATLAPSFAGSPSIWRWTLVLLGPCALFAAALRALPSRRGPLAFVTCLSIAAIGTLG